MMDRILPLLIGLVAVGIFFAYVQPTYTTQIATLSAQVKSYEGALAAADTFKGKESELAAEQDAVPASGRTRIEEFLPDGVDNVQLILDLNALANRSGFKLSDFTIDQPDDAKSGTATDANRIALQSNTPVESLDISVSGSGSYAAFRTFLSGIEMSLRPLDLIDLTVSDSETGIYTYAMKFRIYWLR